MLNDSRRVLLLLLAQRLFQGGSGLVTVALVAQVLSADQQGWLYSFNSLAGLYTLFDLGLSVVLVQTAAHLGSRSANEASSFADLMAWSFVHYARLAIAYVVILVPLGLLLFSGTPSAFSDWRTAWVGLAACAGLSLLPIPFLAVLEGSGGIAMVSGVRLTQIMVGGIATWAALALGLGLWATAMMPLAGCLVPFLWLTIRRRDILNAAWAGSRSAFDARHEIMPLQWRVGVSWAAGYALTQLLTLLLFKLKDPVIAGQMGLSLTMGNMIGLLALSWLSRHVPAMAKAVAQRRWGDLDTLFQANFRLSCLAFAFGAAALCAGHLVFAQTRYVERVLPFWPFAGLMAALFLIHVNTCLASQLRSFRREPLVTVAVCSTVATLVAAAVCVGPFGVGGVVAVLLLVQAVFAMPASLVIWRRRNIAWRTA